MKRFLSIFLVILMLTGLMIPAFAAPTENVISETVEYFDDGSYLVVTISEERSPLRASTAKTGYKSAIAYDSKDKEMWKATIHGVYQYTGTSATCTEAYITHVIYDSSWKLTASSASKSGSKAIGNFTFKNYFLGIPYDTIEKTVTLTCSPTGVLS